MARRRLQQKGDLYAQGGWWRLRWRVDSLDEARKRIWSAPVIVGPAPGNTSGLKAMTEKEARRAAWNQFLSRLDQNTTTPRSVMTFDQFVRERFEPEHVLNLKKKTRELYRSMLKKWILPALGTRSLGDIRRDDCQQVVAKILASGLSTQTAKHARNIMSSVFELASDLEFLASGNPARKVRLPEMQRKQTPAISLEETQRLLAYLETPDREMVQVAVLMSMNIAEIAGLCMMHVNLSDEPRLVNDPMARPNWQSTVLPPWSIGVRRQWVRGEYVSTKASSRERNIPIPADLRLPLQLIAARTEQSWPTAPFFLGDAGGPINADSRRKFGLKPAAIKAGVLVKQHPKRKKSDGAPVMTSDIGWHTFRRTFATLTDMTSLSQGQRVALMGHSAADMTQRYTYTTADGTRRVLDELSGRLFGGTPKEGVVQ